MEINDLCIIAIEHIIEQKENFSKSKMSKLMRKNLEESLSSKIEVCISIATKAIEQRVNPILAVSIAIHESEFEFLTSRPCKLKVEKSSKRKTKDNDFNSCAQGPMQAVPYYLCPNKTAQNCDLIHAGIEGIKRMADLTKTSGVHDPYDYGFCIDHEAQCGIVLAKYNRGMKGQYKKGRLEYRRYAKPILNIYKTLFYKLDLGCTC